MNQEKKIYVGSGKKKFDNLRSISICLEDLKDYAKQSKNGKHYVDLNVSDKKEVDQYGKDIAVSIDTWKPEKLQNTSQKIENDLPF